MEEWREIEGVASEGCGEGDRDVGELEGWRFTWTVGEEEGTAVVERERGGEGKVIWSGRAGDGVGC